MFYTSKYVSNFTLNKKATDLVLIFDAVTIINNIKYLLTLLYYICETLPEPLFALSSRIETMTETCLVLSSREETMTETYLVLSSQEETISETYFALSSLEETIKTVVLWLLKLEKVCNC